MFRNVGETRKMQRGNLEKGKMQNRHIIDVQQKTCYTRADYELVLQR